jgi:hypothetical protein
MGSGGLDYPFTVVRETVETTNNLPELVSTLMKMGVLAWQNWETELEPLVEEALAAAAVQPSLTVSTNPPLLTSPA